jgi:hypothetical protein
MVGQEGRSNRAGAWFCDVRSGSSAHPELSRGGMHVRMKKWREDAQPEWPEAASATREAAVTGKEAQTFPETPGAELLEGGRTQGPGSGRRIRTDPDPAPAAVGSSAPSDPWSEPGATDPDEVTVQLDDMDRRSAEQPRGGNGQDGSDGPVFVDESGRRSRRFRRIGMAIGIACAVYAVVIVITLLSGSSSAPWLLVPGQNDDKPAGKVDSPALPSASVRPSAGGGSLSPGSLPTASDGTTPSPRAGAGKPGASASPGKPSTSADPRPTATGSATTPGGGGPSSPVVQPPVSPPVTPSGEPSPSASSVASPDPSPTAGTGTVADAPVSPPPVAVVPTATAPAEPSPSPEHIL